jgi:hypothetical protein
MEKTRITIIAEDFFSFISAFQMKYDSYNEDDVKKMESIMQQLTDDEIDSVISSFNKIQTGFTEIDNLIQEKLENFGK